MRLQKEEEERIQAEHKARIEELDRQDAEEMARKEEQRALRRQREKEKIEQLKKEGKFMTKAQREEKARNELKLQQMIDAGITVGPSDEPEGQDKKKVVYESRRRPARKTEVCISLLAVSWDTFQPNNSTPL